MWKTNGQLGCGRKREGCLRMTPGSQPLTWQRPLRSRSWSALAGGGSATLKALLCLEVSGFTAKTAVPRGGSAGFCPVAPDFSSFPCPQHVESQCLMPALPFFSSFLPPRIHGNLQYPATGQRHHQAKKWSLHVLLCLSRGSRTAGRLWPQPMCLWW